VSSEAAVGERAVEQGVAGVEVPEEVFVLER
jgi:hypothetical protein